MYRLERPSREFSCLTARSLEYAFIQSTTSEDGAFVATLGAASNAIVVCLVDLLVFFIGADRT